MADEQINGEVNKAVFQAILSGDLEKVGADNYRLTDKGEESAKQSLKRSGGLRAWWRLTLHDVKLLTRNQHETLDGVAEMILVELENRERWLGALAAYATHHAERTEGDVSAVWRKVAELATNDPRDSMEDSNNG